MQYNGTMRSRLLRSEEMGPRASEGTRQLWAAMCRHGWSQNQLAMEIGIDSGRINRWLHGTLSPSLKWAMAMKHHPKIAIEPEAWGQAPRRPIVLRTGTDG